MNIPNANRTMDLLPKSLEKKIPPLYAQEKKGDNAIAYLKLFLCSFTWYITEYDPENRLAFGKTYSHMCPEGELGYISLDEIARVLSMGMAVERDRYFEPTPIKDCESPCS